MPVAVITGASFFLGVTSCLCFVCPVWVVSSVTIKDDCPA